MNSRRPLLYLAAPYTHPDPVENTHRVIKVADVVYDLTDYVPIIPHLTLFWHAVTPHPVHFWYAYDRFLLEACDTIVRLPGVSAGADQELEHALKSRLDQLFYGDLPLAAQVAWGEIPARPKEEDEAL